MLYLGLIDNNMSRSKNKITVKIVAGSWPKDWEQVPTTCDNSDGQELKTTVVANRIVQGVLNSILTLKLYR